MTPQDYPPESLRAEEEGVVKALFIVAENGRVTTCRILASSGHAALDAAACRALAGRARFTPARFNGRPIAAAGVKTTTFSIPR